MKFTNIAKMSTVKPGFLRASAVFGKNILLLFDIDKEVVLDNHRHPHIQFGYCLKGKFKFTANGEDILVREGDSYQLPANLYHSAIAITDYYSMDYKIISEPIIEKPDYNVMDTYEELEGYSLETKNFGGYLIKKLNIKEKGTKIVLSTPDEKKMCLYVSNNTFIRCDGENSELKIMEIYLINKAMEVVVENVTSIFTVEV